MIEEYMTPEILDQLDRISRWKTDNPDTAQELTQETLANMLETNYQHIGQFLHNYRKINARLWKAEQRRRARLVDLETEATAETPSDVDSAIKQLSPGVRHIARLSYAGYTRIEITKRKHISERDLSRKRNQIKAELEALIAL